LPGRSPGKTERGSVSRSKGDNQDTPQANSYAPVLFQQSRPVLMTRQLPIQKYLANNRRVVMIFADVTIWR
jgi:hypothetical protein